MPTILPTRVELVGRTTELAAMRAALGRIARGRGELFLVTGEPGIGKTRLADEVARHATTGGVPAFWGRCREVEGRPPYWPWLQIIQAQVRESGPATVAALMDDEAWPVGHLVPELRPHLPPAASMRAGLESDVARFVLFRATAAFLRRMAADRPTLLILDDLHWADLPSLLLLEYLAYELAESSIMVVATYRAVEVRRQPDIEAVLTRLGRMGQSTPLAGLTLAEATQFIETATGEPVSVTLAQRLHAETEGNPFFLDEIVRLFRGGGSWFRSGATGFPISQGVRGAIRQRLEPLGEVTRELLAIAAVVGRAFDLPLLEAGAGMPRAVLLDRLAPALALEVIVPVAGRPSVFRFSHALVRDTIYEDLGPVIRAELHRRFGEILEQRPGDDRLAEIAHHFFAASSQGGEGKACAYAERAGRLAMQTLAYEEAAEQLTRALHLMELGAEGDAARQCELLLALGDAHDRAGHGEEAGSAFRKALALARRIGSGRLLARAATGLSDVGSAWTVLGRCDDALVAVLREALASLGLEEGVLRARVMARLATELCWTAAPAEIDRLSGDAVAMARACGDRADLAYALVARIHGRSGPDHVGERRALVDEVLALTEGRGDLAVNAYLWRLGDALHLGRMAEVDVCGQALIRAVGDLRQPGDRWMVETVQSLRALLEGRLGDAEAAAGRMLAEPARRNNAEQTASALFFLVQRERGQHRDLAAGLKSLAYQYPAVAVWRSALAMLYADSGELDLARAEFNTVLAEGVGGLRVDLTWLFSLACLSESCRRFGGPEDAVALYDALRPYEGRNVVTGPFYYMGPVSYYLGLLAVTAERPGVAIRHLERALDETRAIGAVPYIARVAAILAVQLRAGTPADRERATQLGLEAAKLARGLGLSGVALEVEPSALRPASGSAEHPVLASAGDHWVLSYGGRTIRLKALKGLSYLALLLESPTRDFHVLDLVAAGNGAGEFPPAGAPRASLGAVFDARAKAELRHRVEELREQVREAERNHDLERARHGREEIERIGEALMKALGLGGRDRIMGVVAERARASVTKAIRSAIQIIGRQDVELARLLSRTIRTGTFCAYEPL